jgi:hypothetical protein
MERLTKFLCEPLIKKKDELHLGDQKITVRSVAQVLAATGSTHDPARRSSFIP